MVRSTRVVSVSSTENSLKEIGELRGMIQRLVIEVSHLNVEVSYLKGLEQAVVQLKDQIKEGHKVENPIEAKTAPAREVESIKRICEKSPTKTSTYNHGMTKNTRLEFPWIKI